MSDTQYYAYRLTNHGRVPLTFAGKRIFGSVGLAYIQHRSRRPHDPYKFVLGVVHPKANPITSKRDQVLAWDRWAVSQAAEIHYQQSRPMPLKAMRDHNLPFATDCSGSCTGGAYAVGLPDPNGLNFNGLGYTGTFLSHAQSHGLIIPREHALPADYCVFGNAPGTHVVRLHQPGNVPDPIVFSHGQESGPFLIHLSAEESAHSGQPMTFIRAA